MIELLKETLRRALISLFLLMSLLAAVLCLTLEAASEQARGSQGGSGASVEVDRNRVPLVAGTAFSMSATITNKTSSIIYLNEKFLRLKLARELEGAKASPKSVWYGTLPAGDATSESDPFATVALKPNNQTSVWWSWSRSDFDQCQTISCRLYYFFSDYIFFEPGEYRMTILIDYWTDANSIGVDPPSSLVETDTADIAAPQFVIVIGATIGGLVCYLVVPKTRRQLTSTSNRYILPIVGALGAMLLSAVITLMVGRISETQFPIHVTVSDFWGALAIGFIANYLGLGALKRVFGEREDESKQMPDRIETKL